jgi:hypothetical protein
LRREGDSVQTKMIVTIVSDKRSILRVAVGLREAQYSSTVVGHPSTENLLNWLPVRSSSQFNPNEVYSKLSTVSVPGLRCPTMKPA